MDETLSVVNKSKSKSKGRLPSLPFALLKQEILGEKYNLSIAFVDEETSQEINKKYRKKDYPTNVLSFSLTPYEGEIILCPEVIKTQTEIFNRNFRELLGFLVIHGMLHLKGMEHSSRMGRVAMELAETKYDQKYFNRNRPGISNHKNSSGRIPKRRKKS